MERLRYELAYAKKMGNVNVGSIKQDMKDAKQRLKDCRIMGWKF